MVIIQRRANRKPSGGRYKNTLSKRTHMLGRAPTMSKIGELRKKEVPTKGGNSKLRLFETSSANIFNPKTKKYEQGKLKNVTANPANKNFVRRNILTKGTIVDTDKGKVRITSRPGQDGVINAILIE